MSRARLWLHVAALVAPLAAAGAWMLVMREASLSSGFGGFVFFGIGCVAVVSAQVAALLRWRALERRAREGHGAWLTGIGMAAITHLLFGVFADLLLVAAVGAVGQASDAGKPSDLALQVLFFFIMSVFALGAITFPATALLAHWIAALRRKELFDHVA